MSASNAETRAPSGSKANAASSGATLVEAEVAIVGAGLVGSSLALLLAEAGMRVALLESRKALVDKASLSARPLPRVSALTPVSQRLLAGLGAWPGERATPYRAMQVWDAQGSGEIAFSADEAGLAVLGHIVENDVTQAALHARLATHSNVTLLLGARLSALQASAKGYWLVLEDGRQVHAPLTVAADGARSTLRSLAGIDVHEEPMEQEAVVTTVRCTHAHGNTARQAFVGGSPLAFLPLTVEGDDHYCSIVWSTTQAHADVLASATPEVLGKMLEEGIGGRLGKVSVCDGVHRFPLVQRHARRYALANLALVGDAAHSIHPLAGQGVNLGLMDAAVLAEEVVSAWRRGAPWGALATLSRFERRRRFDNAAMLTMMKGFKRLFATTNPALTLARNLGMGGMHQLAPLKRVIMRQAAGERGRLPPSCR